MTDLVTFGETMLRYSPPEGERIETTDEMEMVVGGAESNVAVAAAQLGLDVTWMSKLPDSPLGRRITRELRSHGVDPGVVWSETGRVGTYYFEPAGAPRGSNVVYDRDDAAVTTATPDELPLDAIRDASAFHVTGITPALSDTLESTTAAALRVANEAETETVFDLNYREKLWPPERARETCESLLDHVDVLVAARRDAENVLGLAGEPVDVARRLATTHDVGTVVVTRGEEGAVAIEAGDVHEQPVYDAETYDAIGSGDAFVGGFLARRLRGDSITESLRYGAATAAIKRTVGGDAAVVTPEEVDAVVRDDAGGISR